MPLESIVYGTPELVVYSPTKHARRLTEGLNIEFESLDIHVSDVMASFVATLIHFYLTPAHAKVIEVMDTLSLNMFLLNILMRYNLDAIIQK